MATTRTFKRYPEIPARGNGEPGSLVGILVRRPQELTIYSRIAAAGDANVLPPALHDREPHSRATCLVWAADLSNVPGNWRAKHHLKRAATAALAAARAQPALRHLTLLYNLGPQHRPDPLLRAAEGIAARLHALFERKRATYVEVLLIDVTGCPDSTLLETRLQELTRTPAGAAGNRAFDWHDLQHRSVHRATMDDLS